MIPCRPVSLRELAIATCTDQHVDCNYSATLYIAPFLSPMWSWKAKLSLFIDIELLCLLFLWAAIKKSKHAIHKSASKKHDGKYTLLTADTSVTFSARSYGGYVFSPEFHRVHFAFSQLRKEASASTTHIVSSIAIWTALLNGLNWIAPGCAGSVNMKVSQIRVKTQQWFIRSLPLSLILISATLASELSL